MISSRLLYSLLHPAILIETVFHPLLMTDSSLSYLTSSSLVVIKVVTKMSRYRSFESITCDSPLYTSSISMTRSCLSSFTFIHLVSLFESKVYINSRTSTTSMETTTHCYYCFHSVGRTRDIGIIGVRHHLLFWNRRAVTNTEFQSQLEAEGIYIVWTFNCIASSTFMSSVIRINRSQVPFWGRGDQWEESMGVSSSRDCMWIVNGGDNRVYLMNHGVTCKMQHATANTFDFATYVRQFSRTLTKAPSKILCRCFSTKGGEIES